MTWNTGIASLVTKALTISDAAARRLKPCSHRHPHYVKAEPARTERDGTVVAAAPAHYRCDDCGRSWSVTQRDPAWAPTGIVQKFSGHDPSKATSALVRATIEAEQRRFLAANRTTVPKPAEMPKRNSIPATASAPEHSSAQRRRRLPSNVIDISAHRKGA